MMHFESLFGVDSIATVDQAQSYDSFADELVITGSYNAGCYMSMSPCCSTLHT